MEGDTALGVVRGGQQVTDALGGLALVEELVVATLGQDVHAVRPGGGVTGWRTFNTT